MDNDLYKALLILQERALNPQTPNEQVREDVITLVKLMENSEQLFVKSQDHTKMYQEYSARLEHDLDEMVALTDKAMLLAEEALSLTRYNRPNVKLMLAQWNKFKETRTEARTGA